MTKNTNVNMNAVLANANATICRRCSCLRLRPDREDIDTAFVGASVFKRVFSFTRLLANVTEFMIFLLFRVRCFRLIVTCVGTKQKLCVVVRFPPCLSTICIFV